METSSGSSRRRNLSPARRKFYARPESLRGRRRNDPENSARLAQTIRESVVGRNASFDGPFGRKNAVYCDFVASGKAVNFIEDFISDHVLPSYGNTHTTTTATSLQTTHFRDESRDIVRNSVNASEDDAVIFVGSGVTGAVHKLVHALKPRIDAASATIVFASILEHHSNLLPWRDAGAEVVIVPLDSRGLLDLDHLKRQLVKYSGTPSSLLVGVFCAASNVTGALAADDVATTALLHAYGALAFWDYATAAPYVHINVNPVISEGDTNSTLAYKDAVFFSPHKFVGGVQTPGVLVAKKAIFLNPVPNGAGGGSVFFVRQSAHRYLRDLELREEGGTPAIVESVRAAIAIQLKDAVGADFIVRRDMALVQKAWSRLSNEAPNLVLLGRSSSSSMTPRLPVLSFLVRHPETGYFLHHNFVCAVLNDLYGVQARGGCACAGPAAQMLLGISEDMSKDFEDVLLEDERLDRRHLRRGKQEGSSMEILRPGFCRLNLPWFFSDSDVDFVLSALVDVCQRAWTLLPQYIFNNETGEWQHRKNLKHQERKWLGNISYDGGSFSFNADKVELYYDVDDVLAEADKVYSEAPKAASKEQVPDQRLLFQEVSRLRWFLTPFEAKQILLGGSLTEETRLPFEPRTFENYEGPEDFGSYFKNGANGSREKLKRILEEITDLKGVTEPWSWLESLKRSHVINGNEGKENFQTVKAERSVKNGEVGGRSEAEQTDVSGERTLTEAEEDRDDKKDPPTGPVSCARPQSLSTPRGGYKWHHPPKEIFKPFLEAVNDFNMVLPGDRVLVCLSGGKDSLSLLHTLKQYQYHFRKINNGNTFELGAVTVDPQSSGFDPRPLIPYLKELSVPYLYEVQPIMAQAASADYCSSICAFCSRMKRGRLYAAARRCSDNGPWNVLAMGQHLDDLAESFLMSIFHNGRIRTIKANYTVREGDLRVIRPLCYVRERHLRGFASVAGLPVIPENCPGCFDSPKERHRTKQLLAAQELIFPRIYWSLKSAMAPAMAVNRTGVEAKIFGSKNVQGCGEEDDEDD